MGRTVVKALWPCMLPKKGAGFLERQRLLDLLQGHHRDIGLCLIEAEAALGDLDPGRSRASALNRWQLMRRLRSYQLFKHAEIFDPVCRSGDPVKARQASSMKARCVAIGEAYDRHVKKWSTGIDSAPDAYEAETRAAIAAIRQHLDREGAESETLLSGLASARGA